MCEVKSAASKARVRSRCGNLNTENVRRATKGHGVSTMLLTEQLTERVIGLAIEVVVAYVRRGELMNCVNRAQLQDPRPARVLQGKQA